MNYLRSAKMKLGSGFDSSFTSTIVYTPSEKTFESIHEPAQVVTLNRQSINQSNARQPQIIEDAALSETEEIKPKTRAEDDHCISNTLEIILKSQPQADLPKPPTQEFDYKPNASEESSILEPLKEMPKVEVLEVPSKLEARENVLSEVKTEFHSDLVLSQWDRLLALLNGSATEFAVDGESLDLATVIAVAK